MEQVALSENPALPVVAGDRRKSERLRTVYRIARVQVEDGEGLAQIRNVCDDGMKIDLGLSVTLNQWVRIWFSDTVSIDGQVVWTNGDKCGLKFAQPVDSAAILRDTAEENRFGDGRAPRVKTRMLAVVSSEQGIRPARVKDVSQRGMKLVHDGSFTPGLAVKVSLESGLERRGIVRWVKDEFAGLILTEMFSVQDLKSINAR